MARDHMPIQIGLPPVTAWHVAEPSSISYIAFIAGEALPDPGEAFIAAGRAFGSAPLETEAIAIDDERVAWAFGFHIARREARIIMWCERAVDGATPDGAAQNAKWVVFLETLLEPTRAVDDAIALAATVARVAGERTLLVYDPLLGTAWKPEEFVELFLDESEHRGALLDERHLYRVELNARDRVNGPYWISTVGLARVSKPELEMLEVPVADVRAALELIDALAARFVSEDMPAAGAPFEAGPDLRIALVPAAEAVQTLAHNAPGDATDRRALVGPRAALCAAGKRGSFKQIWITPFDELGRLTRNEAGLFLAPRVAQVRAFRAQSTWSMFVSAFANNPPSAVFLAKVARDRTDGEREHMWLTVSEATHEGGCGTPDRSTTAGEILHFHHGDISDWRVVGLRSDVAEVGPESAAILHTFFPQL